MDIWGDLLADRSGLDRLSVHIIRQYLKVTPCLSLVGRHSPKVQILLLTTISGTPEIFSIRDHFCYKINNSNNQVIIITVAATLVTVNITNRRNLTQSGHSNRLRCHLFDIIHLPNGMADPKGFRKPLGSRRTLRVSLYPSATILMILQDAKKFTPHLTSF